MLIHYWSSSQADCRVQRDWVRNERARTYMDWARNGLLDTNI
jgi:hypothetical protein